MGTDNGPQFISEEFDIFVKANSVKHILVFHLHPIGDPVYVQNQHNSTSPPLPDLPVQSAIADSENNEQIPAHEPTVEHPSTTERHYPKWRPPSCYAQGQ